MCLKFKLQANHKANMLLRRVRNLSDELLQSEKDALYQEIESYLRLEYNVAGLYVYDEKHEYTPLNMTK